MADEPSIGLFEKALKASKDGDFVEALVHWNRFLESSPDDAAALSNRGIVKLALGDVEGAIVDQTKSMEILPLEIDPHLNRGIAEEALHLWEEAEKDYNWILKKDPKDALALYNLANVRVSQEKWDEAKDLFEQASLVRSEFPIARSSKALQAYQLGELDEAESSLRNVIRRYPMFADARAALSALLWRKGRMGEAESHWSAVAGLDNRYSQEDWLLNVRRWPPRPAKDLISFLALERP